MTGIFNFAYRSVREIETLLLLSRDLNYLTSKKYSELQSELDLFAKKLGAFMNYIEKNVIKTDRKRDLSAFFRQKKEALVHRENFSNLARP